MTKAPSKTPASENGSATRKTSSAAKAGANAAKPRDVAAAEVTAADTTPATRRGAGSAAQATAQPAPKRGRPAKSAPPAAAAEPDTAARRGRKAKIVEAEDDLHDDLAEDLDTAEVDAEMAVVEEVAAAPAPKTRKASRAREKQLLKEFGYDDSNITGRIAADDAGDLGVAVDRGRNPGHGRAHPER